MTILLGEPQRYGGPARTPEPGGRGFFGRAAEAAAFAVRESPFGLRRLDRETYDELIGAVEAETGERLPNPVSSTIDEARPRVAAKARAYRERGERGSRAYIRAYREEQEAFFNERLDALRQRYPDAKSLAADQSFQSRRARRAGTLERRSGEAPFLAQLAGGLAAAPQDPVNLATAPVGLGAKTILGAAVKGAAVNAGLEAAVQPAVQARRETIGLEASFEAGAVNVLAAGIFGGTVSGAGQGLARIFTRREAAAAGRESPEPELRAGAAEIDRALEIEADVEAAAGGSLSPEGRAAAHQRLDAAERIIDAVDAGEAPSRRDIQAVTGDGPPIPARAFAEDVAVTPRGTQMPVRYAIVELDDLIASHDRDLARNPRFPAELQPRDRGRAASRAQITDIASKLEPRLLGRSASAGDGAPIIRADGVVLSGNGRVLALGQVYERGLPAEAAYRQFLQAEGFPVADAHRPVLVRIAGDATDLEAFAREANERTVAALSAPEQARADAANLSARDFDLLDGADPGAVKNARFVRQVVERITPEAERGALMDARGALSSDGARRVRSAVAAYAYDDPVLIDRLIEGEDELKSLGAALLDAAADFARLRGGIEAGDVDPRVDIRAHVAEAAAIVAEARRAGRNVAEFVGQDDMFTGAIDARTVAILRIFFQRENFTGARARAKIAEELSYYATEARKVSAAPGLFGDAGDPTGRILSAARGRAEGAGTPGLFDPGPRAGAPSLLPEAGEGSGAPAPPGAGEGGSVAPREPVTAAFDDPQAPAMKSAIDAETREALDELAADPEAPLVTGGLEIGADGNPVARVQSRAELEAEIAADEAIVNRLKGCVT